MFLENLELIQEVIDFTSRRKGVLEDEAEDFRSWLMLRLVESGYAILEKFEERSSLRTFLAVVFHREFQDYRTQKWGKWRPSARARRRGSAAVVMERLVNRDGLTWPEAIEIAKRECPQVGPAELEALAAELPRRPRTVLEGEASLKSVPAPTQTDERVRRAAVTSGLQNPVQEAMAELQAQERLVLRLHFEEGISLVQIAQMLGVEQRSVYTLVDRLKRVLRRKLEASGLGTVQLREFLENNDTTGLDFFSPTPETPG